MTPAFGFSVGDFIAAIELCTKIVKALKESGSAVVEYHQLVLELKALQTVFARLAALDPTASNIDHVNAIRRTALASTLPLQDFLNKLASFEPAMSNTAAKKTFSRASKKINYALSMPDEIKRIRAMIYGNVLSVNTMLATHASETLSRVESTTSHNQHKLLDSIRTTTAQIATISHEVEQFKLDAAVSKDQICNDITASTMQIQQHLDGASKTLSEKLAAVNIGLTALSTSIDGVRNLISQIMALMRSIPTELGTMIRSIVEANMRMETTLHRIDQNIAASPSFSNGTNITVEDALGQVHQMPFEWFKYWETFEGFLKARFKDTPGSRKINSGEFRLVHSKRPSVSIEKDAWTATVVPGTHLVMLMVITGINFIGSACPRKSCPGILSIEATKAALLACPQCGLQFISQSVSREDDEAEDVSRVQRLEDMELFGEDLHRNIAQEDVGASDYVDDSFSPLGRNEFHEELDQRKQSSLFEPKMPISNEKVPPIYTWLAQTEQLENAHRVHELREAAELELAEKQEQEFKDLEVFKNVQMTTSADKVVSATAHTSSVDSGIPNINTNARIYYGKLLDSYPNIDVKFARRLATANWERKIRLLIDPERVSYALAESQTHEEDIGLGHFDWTAEQTSTSVYQVAEHTDKTVSPASGEQLQAISVNLQKSDDLFSGTKKTWSHQISYLKFHLRICLQVLILD